MSRGIRCILYCKEAATVYGALLALFFAHFSVFEIEITPLQTICTLGVVTLFLLLLMWNPKYRMQKLIMAVLLMAAVGGIFHKALLGGVSSYYNRFIELYNKYHSVTKAVMVAERTPFSPIITIGILGFVLGMALFLVLDSRKGILLSVLIILLPVLISAFVGKMPAYRNCWLLLVMICIYLKMYHKDERLIFKREILVTAGVLAVLMLSSSILQPMITDYKNLHLQEYKEIRKQIIASQKNGLKELETTVDDITNVGGSFGGGVSKGNLRNQTSFQPTGETAMEVVVSVQPTGTLYLKGYVGSKYTGEAWKEISAAKLSEVIPRIGGADEKRTLLNEPFRRIAEGSYSVAPTVQEIKIELVNASKEFGYAPYCAEVTDTNDVYKDSGVSGGWSKVREYRFYIKAARGGWYGEYMYEGMYDSLISSYYDPTSSGVGYDYDAEDGYGLAEASKLWTEYQEFVKTAYVNDYAELEKLSQFCDGIASANVQYALQQLFNSGYYYSRNPGEMPEDMDFTEGFLFEKKIGFCIHYATAATLVYQMCGVPARYVEGYAISPDQFKRYEDGSYRAVVTDESAHAWCEVFDEEIGWVVREFTPSAGETSSEISDEVQNEEVQQEIEIENVQENPVEEPEEPSQEDVTQENNPQQEGNNPQQEENNVDNSEENTPQGGFFQEGIGEGNGIGAVVGRVIKQLLLKTILIVGIIGVLAFIVILQQKIRRAKRLQSFRQKKDNKGVLSIYNAMYEICTFAGVRPEGENEREKITKIAQQFTCLTEEEWNRVYSLAEQAAFSNQMFSKEEYRELHGMYKKLRKNILGGLNIRKRFIFLYIRAF